MRPNVGKYTVRPMNLKGLSLTMNLTSRSTVPPLVQQYPVEWSNPRGNMEGVYSGNLEFGRLVLGGARKNVLFRNGDVSI